MRTKKKIKNTKQNKKDNRVKYNFEKLWQEFLLSDYLSVTKFFIEKYGTNSVKSGHVRRNTTGWRKRKLEILRKQNEEAEKKIKKETIDIKNGLLETKKLLLKLFKLYVNDLGLLILDKRDKSNDIEGSLKLLEKNTKLLKDVWQIIKIELGEPTSIGKLDNKHIIDEGQVINKLKEAIDNLKKYED